MTQLCSDETGRSRVSLVLQGDGSLMRKQSGVEEQGWEGESQVGAEKPGGPLQPMLLIPSMALWNCFGRAAGWCLYGTLVRNSVPQRL